MKQRNCHRCREKHNRKGSYCSELCEKIGFSGSTSEAMWRALAGKRRRRKRADVAKPVDSPM